MLYSLGEFDQDVVYRSYGLNHLDTSAHRTLALETAQQGMVLLKNQGHVLPLSASRKLAFIGPGADNAGIMASSYGGQNDLINSHTPILAAQARNLSVTHQRGCDVWSTDTSGFTAALQVGEAADVIVFFAAVDFATASEWGNGPDAQNDQISLIFPGVQEQLIGELSKLGKEMVVVMMAGGAVAIESWMGSVDAILHAFFPGELGGDAILGTLLGDENVFGALPITMDPDVVTLNRTFYTPEATQLPFEGGITHMYYNGSFGPPLFEFGYQGSYTTFSFAWWGQGALDSDASGFSDSTSTTVELGSSISYRVNVTNTGSRAGDAIALAIVKGIPPDYPLERLFDVERVPLRPNPNPKPKPNPTGSLTLRESPSNQAKQRRSAS